MKANLLLALLGISILAAGCGNRNGLTGKWSETDAEGAVQIITCQFLPVRSLNSVSQQTP